MYEMSLGDCVVQKGRKLTKTLRVIPTGFRTDLKRLLLDKGVRY